MRLPILTAALLLGACSQAAPPVEEGASPAPAALEDLASEEIGEAAPIEAVPAGVEPPAAAPEQPQYSFDNPPPDAQRIETPEDNER